MDILPFDKLDALKLKLGNAELPKSKDEQEDIIDELLDLFLLSYVMGKDTTNASLSSDWQPTLDEVMKTVDKEVAGKTWRERVEDYFANGGSGDDIVRIADTESHRIANQAAFDTAKAGGATTKTWHCMMLPTSRDTHIYLDGVTAPIDGDFYSFKGGKTKFPGQWGIAEEDVNCLCFLTYDK